MASFRRDGHIYSFVFDQKVLVISYVLLTHIYIISVTVIIGKG